MSSSTPAAGTCAWRSRSTLTYAFLAVFPKPAEEFPSGASCDWKAVVNRHPAPAGHPARVILGLDQRSAPISIELAGESSHLLVSGAPGGGKTMALKAILASLLHNQVVVPRSGAGWEITLVDSVKAELRTRFSAAAVTTASATDPDGVVETLRAFAQGMDERYAVLDGVHFDPRAMPRRLLVIEELGDVQDLMDPGQRAEFTRLLTRIVNVGRGCGISVIAATQRPSSGGAGGAVVGPRIRSAMGRLSFFLNQSSDYAIALDRPVRRLLPRIPGRGALIDGSGDIVILQALQIGDEDIAEVVARATRGGPTMPPSAPPETAEPRRPSAAEIERLDPLTALRLGFRMQHATDGPITVSVRGLMERVREEGFVAGRTERYTASLAVLEQVGILEAQWPGVPTSPRRIVPGMTWDAAIRLLEGAERIPDSQTIDAVSGGVSETSGDGHLTHAGSMRTRRGTHLSLQGRRPTRPAEQPALVVQCQRQLAPQVDEGGGGHPLGSFARPWPPPVKGIVRSREHPAQPSDRVVIQGHGHGSNLRQHPRDGGFRRQPRPRHRPDASTAP